VSQEQAEQLVEHTDLPVVLVFPSEDHTTVLWRHPESAFLLALTPQDKLELRTDKSEMPHSMRPPSVNIPVYVDLLVAPVPEA